VTEFGVPRSPWYAWCCNIGLHFMRYVFVADGYVCPCGKQFLWERYIR
jgi:hypothetical protein